MAIWRSGMARRLERGFIVKRMVRDCPGLACIAGQAHETFAPGRVLVDLHQHLAHELQRYLGIFVTDCCRKVTACHVVASLGRTRCSRGFPAPPRAGRPHAAGSAAITPRNGAIGSMMPWS